MGISYIPLSGSVGGSPILLDNATAPGNLIHANPEDSGANDVVQHILVGNPNPNQITLFAQVLGPGAPVKVVRIDVPPTSEGTEVRLFYTPFILGPGFSYYLRVETQAGNNDPYLYGLVERDLGAAENLPKLGGYGGLRTTTGAVLGDLISPAWVAIPFSGIAVNNPVNVTQDPGNNQLSLGIAGVWAVTTYLTIEFTRNQTDDRILYLRFWNATDGVEVSAAPFPIYIEQGVTGDNYAIPAVPVDISSALVGKSLQIQIGGAASDFTNVNVDKAGFNVFFLGAP